MDWFDCCCGFGVPGKPALGGSIFATAGDLQAELDFCGVGEALVSHVAQQYESPQAGNRLLLEEIEGAPAPAPRLHPTWAILPPQADWDAPTFLSEMKKAGVKAVRAYPNEDRYLLNAVTFGPLFDELVSRRIPLFVGPLWQVITDLLADFPHLTLVCVDHGSWGDDRFFRPLIERYPRFHLDTGNYQLERGLSDFVRKYGPDRLLYSSAAPTIQMGASLLTLAHADMSDDAKAAIAAGNLRRLLGEVKL